MIGLVMQSYPPGTEFLVALGYKGELIRPVAELLARELGQSVSFVETDSYLPQSLGLTQTIIDSRPFLQEPFIFHAVDTLLVKADVPAFKVGLNRVFLSSPEEAGVSYRTIKSGKWIKAHNSETLEDLAYIGLAHIGNPTLFWESFYAQTMESEAGETLGLPPSELECQTLAAGSWIDAGSVEGLARARRAFQGQDVVLPREDEAIWRVGETMVKFHLNPEFISERVERGRALSPFVPFPTKSSPYTYEYLRASGEVLSACGPHAFPLFLKFCEKFWHGDSPVSIPMNLKFNARYIDFYQAKTRQRVDSFLEKNPEFESSTIINGVLYPPIRQLLESVDWESLATILEGNAHGDLHPENVVFDDTDGRFALLDWRQNLAGSTAPEGDVYYDLAKILHGLIVDHSSVRDGRFFVTKSSSAADIAIEIPTKKLDWFTQFGEFLHSRKYDSRRVETLTALIFLNIATLHHHDYDKFLFSLGHKSLGWVLSEGSILSLSFLSALSVGLGQGLRSNRIG